MLNWCPRTRSADDGYPVSDLSSMEDEVRPLLEHAPQRQRSLSVLPWDPWRARKSGALILISVVLERLAYYGVVVNLFLYLNKGQPQVYHISLVIYHVYMLSLLTSPCLYVKLSFVLHRRNHGILFKLSRQCTLSTGFLASVPLWEDGSPIH